MAICDNMRAIRNKKGLTQKQVAEACGLADSTIRTYELGKANPKPSTVAKIAKALGVSVADLYGVGWMPGIETFDQETNSALYQSALTGYGGTIPIDAPDITRLLVAFDRLNSNGKMEAIKRVEEMTQVPEYQSISDDFTVEELEKFRFACKRISNAQLELRLMEQQGVTSGDAVRSSKQIIADATEQIISIALEHFSKEDVSVSDTF